MKPAAEKQCYSQALYQQMRRWGRAAVISRNSFFKPDTEKSGSVVYILAGRGQEREGRKEQRGSQSKHRLYLLPRKPLSVVTSTSAGLTPNSRKTTNLTQPFTGSTVNAVWLVTKSSG